jgi:hypothetical protein
MPIYPFKVHVPSVHELEAFLEFQAKISKNNFILGKNVVLWVHFHPASTVKVKGDDEVVVMTMMIVVVVMMTMMTKTMIGMSMMMIVLMLITMMVNMMVKS